MRITKDESGDHVCEHGTSVDVHCCNCHSGFLFEKDHICSDDESDDDGGYPFDEEESDDESERCPECGAYFEEFHEPDCSQASREVEEWEDAQDCTHPSHPGCHKCEVKP